jgi:putative acetyltransferase
MLLRTETPKDYDHVYQLNIAAFGNREDESKLIERIRLSEEFIPELSIIADNQGEIVGHILLSKAKVVQADEIYDVIVLAPVAVHPMHQKKGIGGMLINEGVKRATRLGYGLVLLIGHPTYYPKFKFQQAAKYGLTLRQFDVPEDVFMVRELIEGELGRISGELQYPKAFFE